MNDKQRILFLCTGNSARSQMAEAFLRHYASERYEVHSAGLAPKEIQSFYFLGHGRGWPPIGRAYFQG